MLLIGTSGYSYPHWGDGIFYPAGLPENRWLEFYANTFDTVELNVSFYGLPKKETFEGWRERTPDGFFFTVKGSRYITHVKKLKDCKDSILLFFDHAGALEQKLGCVLWQLPPNIHADTDRLSGFCDLLSNLDIPKIRHAFEFRHESWFDSPVYQTLREHGFSLCIADSTRWPSAEVVTSDLVYLRFHGGKALYGSVYSDDELRNWAQKAAQWRREQKDVLAYFNNDACGYAVKNAIQLKVFVNKGIKEGAT